MLFSGNDVIKLTLLENDNKELVIFVGLRHNNYFILKVTLNNIDIFHFLEEKEVLRDENIIFNFFKIFEAFVKNLLEFQKVYKVMNIKEFLEYKSCRKVFYFKVDKINKHNYLFLKVTQEDEEDMHFKFNKLEADLIVTMFNRYSRATTPLFKL